MRYFKSMSLGCLLVAFAVGKCEAKTIYVHYPHSIQAAVAAAKPGDTVQVDAGIYREQVTISTQNIELAGAPGAILDGTTFGGKSAGFTNIGVNISATGCFIHGLTVRNYGVGIEMNDALLRVESNTATGCGIGILSAFPPEDSSLKSMVDYNICNGNDVGIELDNSLSVSVTLNIANRNSDTGIALVDGVQGCSITLNQTLNNGGSGNNNVGIYVEFTCSGNMLVLNTSLLNNNWDAEDNSGEIFGQPQNTWLLNLVGTKTGF